MGKKKKKKKSSSTGHNFSAATYPRFTVMRRAGGSTVFVMRVFFYYYLSCRLVVVDFWTVRSRRYRLEREKNNNNYRGPSGASTRRRPMCAITRRKRVTNYTMFVFNAKSSVRLGWVRLKTKEYTLRVFPHWRNDGCSPFVCDCCGRCRFRRANRTRGSTATGDMIENRIWLNSFWNSLFIHARFLEPYCFTVFGYAGNSFHFPPPPAKRNQKKRPIKFVNRVRK